MSRAHSEKAATYRTFIRKTELSGYEPCSFGNLTAFDFLMSGFARTRSLPHTAHSFAKRCCAPSHPLSRMLFAHKCAILLRSYENKKEVPSACEHAWHFFFIFILWQ